MSPELQDAFEAILSNADRGYPNEPYVMMVLQALADGEPLPRLVSEVLRIVRDSSWMPGVRCAALEVLIAYREQGVVGTNALLELLGGVDAEQVDDGGDQLLGLLLKALFPRDLSVAEVLKYLRYPKVANVGSELVTFWTRHVPKTATDDQRAEVLDAIAADFDSYRAFMTRRTGLYTAMGQLPVDLLSLLLRGSMDVIPLDRLLQLASRLIAARHARAGVKHSWDPFQSGMAQTETEGAHRVRCREVLMCRGHDILHAVIGALPVRREAVRLRRVVP